MINLDKFYKNQLNEDELKEIYQTGVVLYRIFNDVNSKSYIGETEKTLYGRFKTHMSAHFKRYLYNKEFNLMYQEMTEFGLDHFFVEILEIDGIHDESYYIEKYDSFRNGYNKNTNGYAGSYVISELIWMHNPMTGEKTRIHPELKREYEFKGFELGGGPQENSNGIEGYIWMTNPTTGVRTRVHPDNIELAKSDGFELGGGPCSDKVWMHHPELGNTRINKDQIEEYESLGYNRGRH